MFSTRHRKEEEKYWTDYAHFIIYTGVVEIKKGWPEFVNRIYLKSKNSVIYTFYASACVSNTTPQGNYATQVERASHFYNAGEVMGANCAISCYNTEFISSTVFHLTATETTLLRQTINLVNLLHHTDALDYQFLIVIGYTLKHFLDHFLLVLQWMFINKVVVKR